MSSAASQVTLLIESAAAGDKAAADALLPLIYNQLRAAAQAHLANERPNHTLQPTALVHEAYLELAGPRDHPWRGRAHFFSAAAEAMRRILIDHARARLADKRGGSIPRLHDLPLDALTHASQGDPHQFLDLSAALDQLAAEDPDKAQLIKLRFFAGLTLEDAGRALGLSPATADRHWAYVKAWLYRRLSPPPGHENS